MGKDINKIELTAEKKTLLITLFAKAADYKSKDPILNDKKAYEIASSFDVDAAKLNEFGHNEITVVRARQLDEWLKKFINKNKSCVVLNLGCGLDSRVSRINPLNTVQWFDVDYPVVIKLRREFYSDSENYHMISSSITQQGWVEKIPSNLPVMVVAEGVFEYINGDEVKTLLNKLTQHFAAGEIAFDVMSSFAINAGRQELKRTMGAKHKWAVDDVSDVDRFNPKLKRMQTLSVFDSKYARTVEFNPEMVFEATKKIPNFKDMIRLLLYQF